MDKIRQLQDMINESNRIVFFGGAGVEDHGGLARLLQTGDGIALLVLHGVAAGG